MDAAAGVTVYRGGAYPKEYYGSVFTGEAQNNLVHRRKLIADLQEANTRLSKANRELAESESRERAARQASE